MGTELHLLNVGLNFVDKPLVWVLHLLVFHKALVVRPFDVNSEGIIVHRWAYVPLTHGCQVLLTRLRFEGSLTVSCFLFLTVVFQQLVLVFREFCFIKLGSELKRKLSNLSLLQYLNHVSVQVFKAIKSSHLDNYGLLVIYRLLLFDDFIKCHVLLGQQSVVFFVVT